MWKWREPEITGDIVADTETILLRLYHYGTPLPFEKAASMAHGLAAHLKRRWPKTVAKLNAEYEPKSAPAQHPPTPFTPTDDRSGIYILAKVLRDLRKRNATLMHGSKKNQDQQPGLFDSAT